MWNSKKRCECLGFLFFFFFDYRDTGAPRVAPLHFMPVLGPPRSKPGEVTHMVGSALAWKLFSSKGLE